MNKKIIWIVSLICFFLSIVGYMTWEKKKEENAINALLLMQQYPLLDLYENVYMEFDGIVQTSVEDGKLNKGVHYITLTNGKKFSIFYGTKNTSYKPAELGRFIQPGDSISKWKDDIYFFVFRDSTRYIFKMRENIKITPPANDKKE